MWALRKLSWSFLGRPILRQKFSFFFKDFQEEDLPKRIKTQLQRPYLGRLKEQEQILKVHKGIFEEKKRYLLISLPARGAQGRPVWVHFLILTDSPKTFLSKEACEALKVNEGQDIWINGRHCSFQRSTGHFEKINILGMDYLENISLRIDGKRKIIKIEEEERND